MDKERGLVSRGHSDPISFVRQRKRVTESTRWLFQVRRCSPSTRRQCTQRHQQAIVWQRQAEWRITVQERERAKEKARSTMKNIQRKIQMCPRRRNSNKGKGSAAGLSGLEHSKSGAISETEELAQTYPTDNSYTNNSWCDDDWSYAAWDNRWSSV